MPTRVDAARAPVKSNAALPRAAALKAVFATFEKAINLKKPPKADLTLKTSDLEVGKGGVKAVVIDLEGEKDRKLLGLGSLPADRLLIDDAKKQLYVEHFSGVIGPLPLPAGVSVRTFIDPGPFPKARSDYQKAIATVASTVLEGLPQALRKDRTQFDFQRGAFVSPSGERMKHVYIKDHIGVIPGEALLVGKKEFWVEMIPGVSGECIGPFALPKGFSLKTLEDKYPTERSGRGGKMLDDDSGGRGSSGYDSSRGFPDSLGRIGTGGRSSGVTPMRGSLWGNDGGGGGSPS